VYLDAHDILGSPPRTADYESLRPYYIGTGPRLSIDEVEVGAQPLRAITFEGSWKSGVFRVERLGASLWEGNVLGDLAFQVTANQNVRTRLRLTLTELNLDIPYALAKKVAPIANVEDRKDYKISGTMDVQFGLRERAVTGSIDLAKFRKPSVDRLFDLILDNSSPAKDAMAKSEQACVRPVGGHIWITRNLLSLTLDWERIYWRVRLDNFINIVESIPGVGIAMSLTLGTFVMDTVNNSVRGVSIGNILEEKLSDTRVDALFAFMAGRVIAERKESVPPPSAGW
jgi:hypothetical protein